MARGAPDTLQFAGGKWVIIDTETGLWRDAVPEEYAGKTQKAVIDPETGLWRESTPEDFPAGSGTIPSTPTAPAPPPAAPTYTPGIVFGSGRIPGSSPNADEESGREDYQRKWFNTGKAGNEEVDHAYYDANWDVAWQNATNSLGGNFGTDFSQFLQGFGSTAKKDFNLSTPYDPNLHVANFIDEYAPQVKGIWDLMGSQKRGQSSNGLFAGRSVY